MKTRFFLTAGLVTALFSMIVSPALAVDYFDDLSSSHPNYEAIMALKDLGVIDGYPDDTFKPERDVNRVEALKIILLAAKIDIDSEATESRFTDTNVGVWYAPILNRAVALGIIQGYPDGSFKPEQTVNLAEALKIGQLSFDIDISGIEVPEDPYADTPADSWYAKYVQFAKNNSLIDTDSNNKVYPGQAMSRAKLCEMIYRLMNLSAEAITPDENTSVSPTTNMQLNVSIEKYIFKNKDMTIGVGSTVTWTNNSDIEHSVTADDSSLFDSGTLQPGETFNHTFNEEGTFLYHSASFDTMTGSITVKPANEVPTI